LGLITPTELRNYICKLYKIMDKSDFNAIPNESLIPNYVTGVLINGLADTAKKMIIRINKQLDTFENLDQKDQNAIINSGIIHGMINRLKNLEEMCESKFKNSNITEFINLFAAPDVDSLSKKERNIQIRVGFLDSL
jgi:hypothetical protein